MTTKAKTISRWQPGVWLGRARKSTQSASGQLFDAALESFTGLVILVLVTGIIGGALALFGPYLIRLPDVLGYTFAGWCINRGSCDLTTNLTSVAIGTFLLAAIPTMLFYAVTVGLAKQSDGIYYDVRNELQRAGDDGIEPLTIAKRTGHSPADVHTMIGFLFDDGETEVCGEGVHGIDARKSHRVRYRLVKDGKA